MENEKLFEFMEKIYSEMKDGFKDVKSDINGMKSDITGMKSDIIGMKSDITGMKSDITDIKSDITGMKSDIQDLKAGQIRIEQKLDIIHDQTAKTCEDVTLINSKLDTLSKDLNVVEVVTGKNMTDIAHLKAVK